MTHSTAHNRSQLEQLWQAPTVARCALLPAEDRTSNSISAAIQRFAQDLLAFCTGTQQLRIWTKSTKQGVVWFAYDPMSDQRIAHCSELELRTWLESRHHH
ncbi:MAG: hypothetical protein AAFO84_10685 [Cyanobacteria bacterium J06598_1]